jgi:hypothetical protein
LLKNAKRSSNALEVITYLFLRKRLRKFLFLPKDSLDLCEGYLMKFLFISVLVLLTACEIRPTRIGPGKKGSGGAMPSPPSPPSPYPEQLPEIPAHNEPIDSYLSIGPYLQKELEAPAGAPKVIKIYAQIRQENSVSKNFDDLKAAIAPTDKAISAAIEAAQKSGLSTVEFDIEVSSLKSALGNVNKALSSIEISLPLLGQ